MTEKIFSRSIPFHASSFDSSPSKNVDFELLFSRFRKIKYYPCDITSAPPGTLSCCFSPEFIKGYDVIGTIAPNHMTSLKKSDVTVTMVSHDVTYFSVSCHRRWKPSIGYNIEWLTMVVHVIRGVPSKCFCSPRVLFSISARRRSSIKWL